MDSSAERGPVLFWMWFAELQPVSPSHPIYGERGICHGAWATRARAQLQRPTEAAWGLTSFHRRSLPFVHPHITRPSVRTMSGSGVESKMCSTEKGRADALPPCVAVIEPGCGSDLRLGSPRRPQDGPPVLGQVGSEVFSSFLPGQTEQTGPNGGRLRPSAPS